MSVAMKLLTFFGINYFNSSLNKNQMSHYIYS